jgi:GT2 family glycosyltransferase
MFTVPNQSSLVTENAFEVSNSAEIDVSVVVVNYNTGRLLDRMFAALNAASGSLKVEIIVVDNASTDDSIDILESKYPLVTLLKNRTNVGFGRANNQAIQIVRGRYVLLLNTDAFVAPATLVQTVNYTRSQASGSRRNASALLSIFSHALERFSREVRPCKFFPNHSARGRHDLGSRFDQRV